MKFLKKMLNKIKTAIKNTADKAARAVRRLAVGTRTAVAGARAEGYVDTGVKILIAVVIGALLLAGLYALFNNTILPTVTSKVQGLFNYSGT